MHTKGKDDSGFESEYSDLVTDTEGSSCQPLQLKTFLLHFQEGQL